MEDGGANVENLVPPPNSEDGTKREEKVEDVGGGGQLINNLISILVTPLSPSIEKSTTGHESADDHEQSGGVDNGGEGGGIFSKMISNFIHQRDGEGVVETEDDDIMAAEKTKRLKTDNGGIIHNIVSHLPHALQDGAVPTADEATILINSLVRD